MTTQPPQTSTTSATTGTCLLAIDCGTQSVRALLFDLRGNLLGRAQVAIDAYQAPHPGWLECDPDVFWQSLCQACKQLWAETDVPKSAVAGVVLTTQRGSTVALDRQGQPLHPAIIWLDQRRADVVPRLSWWWSAALTVVGMRQTVRYFQHEAEANWLARHRSDLWAATDKFLLLSGYLNYRFTGRYVDSAASQVGYIPFDYKRGRWAARHDWKWQALPIKASMLPELVSAGTCIGSISPEVERLTGIPAGLPLIAGAADKACEVLGAGCLEPDIACLSFGTTATVCTTTPRYLEALPFVPAYQAAVPGHFNTEIQITRGFWMVQWFKTQFGLAEQQLSATRGVPPEKLLDDLVNAVPPGAQGLVLQPFWSPGIKWPGPEARGAMVGFSAVHTRAHVYRAILEGLAFALRAALQRIERRSGQRVRRLRVCGGGSQSDAAMQITANVFNLPCERAHVYETSGLGAAILAAVSLKLKPDFATALADMTRPGELFTPQPEHVTTYEQLYRRVYRRLYARLQPLYRSLRWLSERSP